MNIQMNQKQISPLNAVKSVYASVIEDITEHFDDYAKVFIRNFDEYNEEELKVIGLKNADLSKKINAFLRKNELV